MPGWQVTIAFSRWINVLKSVDLPEFVVPAIATLTPSRIRSPTVAVSSSETTARRHVLKTIRDVRIAHHDPLIDKVQRSLDIRKESDELPSQAADLPRQAPMKLLARQPKLPLGIRVNEVVDGLRLEQVHLPVGNRSPCELSGRSRAGTGLFASLHRALRPPRWSRAQ